MTNKPISWRLVYVLLVYRRADRVPWPQRPKPLPIARCLSVFDTHASRRKYPAIPLAILTARPQSEAMEPTPGTRDVGLSGNRDHGIFDGPRVRVDDKVTQELPASALAILKRFTPERK